MYYFLDKDTQRNDADSGLIIVVKALAHFDINHMLAITKYQTEVSYMYIRAA